MQRAIQVLLAVVAIIHLLPVVGLLGAERLRQLYGLALDDPSLLVLMRHRAALFGLLGAFLLVAVWRPRLVPLALVGGWVSVVSFLVLAALHPGHSEAIGRVVRADWVAAAALLAATALWEFGQLGE